MDLNTKILKINPKKPPARIIQQVVSTLKRGGTVILPTDTVYGLAAMASHKKAVQKIYKIKQRKKNLPLPIFCSSVSQVRKIVGKINLPARKLIKYFWPGKLTLVLACQSAKFSHLAYNDKIGIRISKSRVVGSILKRLGQPIIGTSANLSDKGEITLSKEIIKLFKHKVDIILDGGNLSQTLPSTVIDVSSDKPKIVRYGAVTQAKIEKVLKPKFK